MALLVRSEYWGEVTIAGWSRHTWERYSACPHSPPGGDEGEPGARGSVGVASERRVQVGSLLPHVHSARPQSCLRVRIRPMIHELLKTVEETTLI